MQRSFVKEEAVKLSLKDQDLILREKYSEYTNCQTEYEGHQYVWYMCE